MRGITILFKGGAKLELTVDNKMAKKLRENLGNTSMAITVLEGTNNTEVILRHSEIQCVNIVPLKYPSQIVTVAGMPDVLKKGPGQ